jgi:putative solute:sodium symporter small subunit
MLLQGDAPPTAKGLVSNAGFTIWRHSDLALRDTCSITHFGGTLVDDLTDEQRRAYWRYNITLTTILLIIWFVAAYIISGLLAGWLNQYTFLGFPLGYYMAAQGSLAIFVIEIVVYAYLMNRLDISYGIREE